MDIEQTFDALVGDLEYPMFIVTARAADGEPLGCLVGFATQMSIHPRRFSVCISHKNHTYRRGGDSTVFGVHCVPEDGEEVAELFGGETGDEVDKFARAAWHDGPEGVPLLDACPDRFVGRVVWRHDAGDHDAYLLEPLAAEAPSGHGELSFHRAKRIDPGHEA